MSLRARITLLVALAVAVTVSIVAGAAYASARTELHAEVDTFLRDRAEVATGADLGRGRGPFRGESPAISFGLGVLQADALT